MILRAFARLKPGITIKQAAAAMEPLFQQSLNYVPPQFRHEVSFGVRSLRDRQIQDSPRGFLGPARRCPGCPACRVYQRREPAPRAGNQPHARAGGSHRSRSDARTARSAGAHGKPASRSVGRPRWLRVRPCSCCASLSPSRPKEFPGWNRLPWTFAFSFLRSACRSPPALLFGLASALRRPLPELLTGKEIHSTAGGVLRHALVTVQIAVSLVLLAGAGLLLRSLWKLESVSLGMDAKSVITAGLDLAPYRYPRTP